MSDRDAGLMRRRVLPMIGSIRPLVSASTGSDGCPRRARPAAGPHRFTVEAWTATCSFPFVPRIGSVETLLDRLGAGTPVTT